MRLIDADAYKKYLDENWIVANYDAIDAQPTIDAIEVVRCKYCIYYPDPDQPIGRCKLRGDNIFAIIDGMVEPDIPKVIRMNIICPRCGIQLEKGGRKI